MINHEIVLKHEMPRIWHALCLIGSAACLVGFFTNQPVVSVGGLLVTGPCLAWYVVSRHRLRRLGRRLEDPLWNGDQS